ncbi:UDP-N-acetylglucosamine--N-acetylmuramyl-(pentapeptide)pyrophosphoryl-undecaprenolN-acetylglucosaminetransferase [Candidatus Providencia siddallii]|uniref:UDP-N-acetylglucosamine--N-acetylmuramyl-(pentapeptide) pyrophosphoryl-undecaprenol N-acetylglucosamine transferase n=1 Tax=Candidatus Providencia siddallii TaxID=1715285 RepID=A0A0M6W6T4_9GAMM|nr:UDP-N-acetylglucosamine--N-acetylmuramyl-(pentapeptide)pyrophosphoryl-undecaprenolN-acetylglucosaminetransferase [Candidatus Providencia siddallii]
MNQVKKMFLIAGGTGGHIFPGIAIAHYLQAQGWEIKWLGTADRMEAILVPKHGIDIEFIQISGVREKGVSVMIKAPWNVYKAVRQAKKIIQRYQPNVVLGMGGYVSGPGGIAAWQCGIPIVLHEQNGVAGLTNKFLSQIAKCVLQAFPGAFPNATVVGNPIRKDILSIPSPEERILKRNGAIRVLVLGGSQGAHILNQTMPSIAAKTNKQLDILHQTGNGNKEITQFLYQKQISDNFKYEITEFIEDIAKAYAWADIVICRSGALTVSEISAVGLPAIFIPFPHKDRQQYLNALPLERVGAAKILHQQLFTADAVSALLDLWDRTKLLSMAKIAYNCAITNSTNKIAEIICKVAGNI